MVRYLLAWLPMVGIAVANGAFREGWLVPQLGEHQGRQASTLLLIVFLVGYIAGEAARLTAIMVLPAPPFGLMISVVLVLVGVKIMLRPHAKGKFLHALAR